MEVSGELERRHEPRPVGWMAGILLAAGAAVLYSITNALMRQLATGVDPWFPPAIRALVTLVFFLPVLAWSGAKGVRIFPGWKPLLALTAVSVCSQLAGNVLLQYSIGVLGVALAIPLCTGSMVVGSAVLGRVFLGEQLHSRMVTALGVLLLSIYLFQNQSQLAAENMARDQLELLRGWSALAGVVAATVPGIAFAMLSVTIRSMLSSDTSRVSPIVIVSLTGVFAIGPVAAWRLGMDGMIAIDEASWWLMLGAGMGNALAFVCLTGSLKLLPVAWVNAVNVAQVAMAALVGVMFFGEPSSYWLWAGLGVMLAGFGLLFRRA